MIVITNIGGDPLGECEYQIRIGERIITHFKHNRNGGLAVCLKKASEAVEQDDYDRKTDLLIRLMEKERNV